MNASPRGWCPGVHQPMSMPDGLMVRVKPHAGELPAPAARMLAEAAAREGCGAILLTSRANLQLRGLTAAGVERFAAAMVACGLAQADPAFERRRNLIVSPLAGIDPAVDPAARPIADAIAAGLRKTAFAGLPDKFGFVVDGGGCLPLGRVSGDVRLRAEGGDWLLWPDGAASARRCRPEAAPAAALALARAYLACGGRRRMRDVVDSLSPLGGGEGRGEVGDSTEVPPQAAVQQLTSDHGRRPPPHPTLFAPGAGEGFFAVFTPPGGIITPTRLAALAHTSLRLTPWRAVLVPGFAELPP